MRKLFIVSALLLAVHFHSAGQQPPFSQVMVNLPQLAYSALAWGDFDHDGDLDLALTGAEGNTPVTKIFRNDNGTFTDLAAGTLPLHFGSVEWGDYDQDGDLDLLVTGIEASGTPHTMIYQNNDDIFTDTGISLPGVMDGQATWGDFNNDGNLDILLAGSSLSAIYENNGTGGFVNTGAPLPNVETAMCSWNDYNNDGQADVLVCGNTGGGIVSTLYRNIQGVFTAVNVTPEPFTGLYGGQSRWADLDRDGDQDLVIAGMDLYVDGYFLIYRNDGNDHFTKFDWYSANLLNPFIDLGDFNGDGLVDIALIGTISGCGGVAVTRILKNQGSMDFMDISPQLPGYKLGGVTWGDYNNDGYSDLLFTGLNEDEIPKTELYLNNLGNTLFTLNTAPTPPVDLNSSMEADQVILRWNSSSDAQTPKDALSYNIRIGTLPYSYEILSPLAVLYSGYRTVSAPGNASADTSWIIRGIPPGTYYFSVQAIDNGFMPGAFSPPGMFNYTPVGIGNHESSVLNIFPNPCHDRVMVQTVPLTGHVFRIRILNSTGFCCHESTGSGLIDVSTWPSGLYLVQLQSEFKVVNGKFIKE